MINTLTQIGLSPKAAQTYLKCLELGPASMTDMARATGLKRPTMYLVAEELQLRGLLSVSQQNKRTLYTPTHPRRVLQIAQNRLRNIEEDFNKLESLYFKDEHKPRVQTFEGEAAMGQIYQEIYQALGKRQEALFFADQQNLLHNFPNALNLFYQQLEEFKRGYRVRELLIDNKFGREHKARMDKMDIAGHKVRFLSPEKYDLSHTDNVIFGDKVVLFSFGNTVSTVVIENTHLAKSYRSLFNAAWESGI